jgi:hypothetical protein
MLDTVCDTQESANVAVDAAGCLINVLEVEVMQSAHVSLSLLPSCTHAELQALNGWFQMGTGAACRWRYAGCGVATDMLMRVQAASPCARAHEHLSADKHSAHGRAAH